MINKQIQINEIEGKTIKYVFDDYTEMVLMIFSDNTHCVMYAYKSDYDDKATIDNCDFYLSDWWHCRYVLVECGIVSQVEVDDRQAQLDRREKELVEQRRKEYERLKAEFEQ